MMTSFLRDCSVENFSSQHRTNSLLTSYYPYSYTYMVLSPDLEGRMNEAARRRTL
ncbi:MAG: hypothetical protein OJF51_003429 [Nitrospira sp.]|nr:MAG: hypothetical protein OJF51_003429 [Nitrospira sp.]